MTALLTADEASRPPDVDQGCELGVAFDRCVLCRGRGFYTVRTSATEYAQVECDDCVPQGGESARRHGEADSNRPTAGRNGQPQAGIVIDCAEL